MKKLMLFLMVAVLASTADANLLSNPSFEVDTVADGSTITWTDANGLDGPTNWVNYDGTVGVWNPTGDGTGDFDSAVPDGENVLMTGDPPSGAEFPWADVYQESVPFVATEGFTIDFSVMHAGLSSGKGIQYVGMTLHLASSTDPYASPKQGNAGDPPGWMINLNRATDDRDWKEYTFSYAFTAADVTAGYEGVTVGLTAWTTSGGTPSSQNNPVYWDDAVMTITTGVNITEPNGPTSVSELGPTSDFYTLALKAVPDVNVIITVAPDTQTEVDPNILTFTPSNWDTEQVVTVTAIDDDVKEGPHNSIITHTSVCTDPNFNDMSIADVNVAVADDDLTGVSITETDDSTDVYEPNTYDTYTLVLDAAPGASVTVTVDPDTQTEVNRKGAGNIDTLTFTTSDWATEQTATIRNNINFFIFLPFHC